MKTRGGGGCDSEYGSWPFGFHRERSLVFFSVLLFDRVSETLSAFPLVADCYSCFITFSLVWESGLQGLPFRLSVFSPGWGQRTGGSYKAEEATLLIKGECELGATAGLPHF